MKKQVTFAGSLTVHRLHQDETSARGTWINEPKPGNMLTFLSALKPKSRVFYQGHSSVRRSVEQRGNPTPEPDPVTALSDASSGLKMNRAPTVRREPQLEHVTTIKIPKTMTAAPFLKHTALTPAQREYLYTIAASHSSTHVRQLITQHYMNVLHRCIRTGHNPEGDDLVGTSVALLETKDSDKHRSEVSFKAKHKEKINTNAKNPGKSFLPKILNKQARLSNTSASKQRKTKKCSTSSITLRGKSPRRAMLSEEEKEDDEQVDSLSDCLSSLSVGEWDDDTLSQL